MWTHRWGQVSGHRRPEETLVKITDIELHEIHPPLQEFNCHALQLHLGSGYDTRTIVVLHTDDGLQGLGDVRGPPDARLEEEVEQLRGASGWMRAIFSLLVSSSGLLMSQPPNQL